MTIGELARRTGLSIKAIRQYEAAELIYSAGRTEGNYRLFDETALLCAQVLCNLRALGLTVKEIEQLADIHHSQTGEPIGPRLAAVLERAERRTEERLAELEALRERIAEYRSRHAAALADRCDLSEALLGRPGVDLSVAFARGAEPRGPDRSGPQRHAA